MPFFITSKFSFQCKCDKSQLNDLKSALDNGTAFVSLKHEDSLISVWIHPADCVKGKLDIHIKDLEITIEGDFTAKSKMTPKAYKEISASSVHKWTTDGLSISDRSFSISGHDEIEIPVSISDKK